MQYIAVPSYSSWQRDSDVTFAIRKNDIVLDRIDNLVEHYWSSEALSKRLIFLCHIFVTLDYWLKMYKTSCRMEKGREPAVRALHSCAAEQLCAVFGCSIAELPHELELMWGRELSASGVHVDIVARPAGDISRAEAAKHRVWFKGGKAYMLQSRLELAESNFESFVLSMSRELFLAMYSRASETVQCSGASSRSRTCSASSRGRRSTTSCG